MTTKPIRIGILISISLLMTATGVRMTVLAERPDIDGTSEPAIYIIQLVDPPVASYQGGLSGLSATSPTATKRPKLDVKTPASIAYRAYLKTRQTEFLTLAEQAVGHSLEIVFDYQFAFNGLAMRLTPQEAVHIATLPRVRQVQRDFPRQLHTDFGPTWIGAPAIWDGSGTGGLPGTQGEGIIVGIIDTGINMDHPSFADIGGDGYDHNNPLGSGNYVGWCSPGHPDYDPFLNCNDKLIGVWDFVDAIGTENDGPEDSNGHGSHTASTAAGNVVLSSTAILSYPTYSYSGTISGVAPHANIIAYDTCVVGGCYISALVAAIDQTVADGVDVINYSIGGDSWDPWFDSDALAFLGAFEAGIVPVDSAGNDGPSPETIGSPADAPWMMAVGASSHNRRSKNALVDLDGPGSPPADIQGKSLTSSYGPAPIVYAGDYGDSLCLNPFPADTWHGEIVVCDRGIIARVEKGTNVQAGGAGGLVLANALDNGDSLVADPHFLPAVHITYDDGVSLKNWLASGSGHTAAIAGTTLDVDPLYADIMAGFSSRGPNPAVPNVIKPDLTAPGVDIFAAYKDGDEFFFLGGTSMSSPHVAGAAALLRDLHPDWSPAEIKSALMTTAVASTVLKEDGATPADPFDMGAGRPDLSRAGRAGLVLDVTAAEFEAANPALIGIPKTLNLPSMADSDCDRSCSWTRTFRSTLAAPSTWNVSTQANAAQMGITVNINSVTVAAGDTFTVAVEVDSSALNSEEWHFGALLLSESGNAAPDARLPIAVYATGSPSIYLPLILKQTS